MWFFKEKKVKMALFQKDFLTKLLDFRHILFEKGGFSKIALKSAFLRLVSIFRSMENNSDIKKLGNVVW